MNRPFKTPMVPLVPILSILFSSVLIISLSGWTLLRLVVWLAIGLVIYFTYSRKHSKVQLANRAALNAKPTPSMAD